MNLASGNQESQYLFSLKHWCSKLLVFSYVRLVQAEKLLEKAPAKAPSKSLSTNLKIFLLAKPVNESCFDKVNAIGKI